MFQLNALHVSAYVDVHNEGGLHKSIESLLIITTYIVPCSFGSQILRSHPDVYMYIHTYIPEVWPP
jgi:hypothetical protein